MTEIIKGSLYSLFGDREGNFSITTALLLPILFAMASVAMNLASALSEGERMQTALDAAAVASVKAYGEGKSAMEAKAEAWNIFRSNFTLPVKSGTDQTVSPLDQSSFLMELTEPGA